MKDAIFIIYPERRWVALDKIESMYCDAVANNEIAPGLRDQHEMAAALEDMGWITIGEPLEDDLVAEYAAWCRQQRLPQISAHELAIEDVTEAQREWLRDFIERWQRAIKPPGD